MSFKLGCPKCDSRTSAIFRAYEEGLPCPYCGADIFTAENQQHYYDQLPE